MHLFEASVFYRFHQSNSFGSLQLSDMQNWGNLLSCLFCLRTKRGGKETRVGHFSPLLPFLLLSTQTLICLKTVNPAFCFPSSFSEKGRFLVGEKKLFFPRGVHFPLIFRCSFDFFRLRLSHKFRVPIRAQKFPIKL